MSIFKMQFFVLKWAVVLFIITSLISLLFLDNGINFIIGMTVGVVMHGLIFLINNYRFDKILSTAKRSSNTSNMWLVLINVLWMIIIFLITYLILDCFKVINLQTIIGLFIGVGFIPIVITFGGLLQSLYIIRNKF